MVLILRALNCGLRSLHHGDTAIRMMAATDLVGVEHGVKEAPGDADGSERFIISKYPAVEARVNRSPSK